MKVAVIMSTYNGQKYLHQQIESILAQKGVEVELFIRDDGSTDETVNIIKEYEEKYINVHTDVGPNVGFQRSFILELNKITNYEYYAFSDQDDFWEKEKLYRACKEISTCKGKEKSPIVYYSNLNIADENLNIYKRTKLERRKHSLESVAIRRSIAGCTLVFNTAMWRCINCVQVTDDMLGRGHDSFIISLCYAVSGEVICDSNAYIRYRQHSNNVSGGAPGLIQRIEKEWNVLVNKRGAESAIAQSILSNWSDMIGDKEQESLRLISESNKKIKSRLRIFFSKEFTTGDWRLTTIGKLKVILGFI